MRTLNMPVPDRDQASTLERREERGFLAVLVGDGVLPLLAVAGGLVLAGAFLVFVGLGGQFLPHDIAYLGMSPAQLCELARCRVVEFMIHDRVAFGGALFAIGVLYAYLVLFPLRRGEPWAWWLLVVSGTAGFASFLAYLRFGYLDTWHGVGTLLLLPVFVVGLARSRRLVHDGRGVDGLWSLWSSGRLPDLRTRRGLGWLCLVAGAAGTMIGGASIFYIGVSDVFVPEDLQFIGLTPEQLAVINPRLVPLIAHDREGFGGAVFTLGLTTLVTLWCSVISRALWQALLIAGGVGLTAAIGTHFDVGYINAWHLAPAVAAALSMVVGLTATMPRWRGGNTPLLGRHSSATGEPGS